MPYVSASNSEAVLVAGLNRIRQCASYWALLMILLCVPEASAHSWRVEKDGSGDYTMIQDAVDAAAPGDSVSIGPGRYDQFTPIIFPTGIQETIVRIQTDSLTLVGDSREEVVIGPEVRPESTASHEWLGIRIEDVRAIRFDSFTFVNTLIGGLSLGELSVCDVKATGHQ